MIKKILAASVMTPLLSFGIAAAPVVASDDVNVIATGDASISNAIVIGVTTGGNTAFGGDGGEGGNGGHASGEDLNTGGAGGDGGSGGGGGGIVTGEVVVEATVENWANILDVEVGCECAENGDENGSETDDVNVTSDGTATLDNETVIGADTGANEVDGGNGNFGGQGGEASGEEENAGGDGGVGGNGGEGGVVETGRAEIRAHILNRLNLTLVRVR